MRLTFVLGEKRNEAAFTIMSEPEIDPRRYELLDAFFRAWKDGDAAMVEHLAEKLDPKETET